MCSSSTLAGSPRWPSSSPKSQTHSGVPARGRRPVRLGQRALEHAGDGRVHALGAVVALGDAGEREQVVLRVGGPETEAPRHFEHTVAGGAVRDAALLELVD